MRNLFDYGQRWSLLIIAPLIVVLLPLSLLTTPRIHAARLACSSTRSARRTSAAAMLQAAAVTVWVTGPALASDLSNPDIASLIATTAWRAAHAACAACAHASLHIANALLYTSYDDLCASADADPRRSELRIALPFSCTRPAP